MGIFLYLITGLTDRYTAFLQLHMDDRHSIDKQHEIPSSGIEQFILSRKYRLLCDLISTLSSGDLLPVVDLQIYFFSKVSRIIRVISLYSYNFSIDKTI